MPILIINMGGEMLYILEQRLQAQNIVEEKAHRVLQDVLSTMFGEKFIQELFKPQRMYSSTSTRQIFDRLAHSSIMRLNQSSMDKLYDLMTMGCKYQVVSSIHPAELQHVCLNHLEALRSVKQNDHVRKLVENSINQTDAMFANMGIGDLYLLRYTLCRFFQDRRVKVSLFLSDNLQAQDGSIIHTHAGRLPRHTEKPGIIRYFSSDGTLQREETIKVANAEKVLMPSEVVTTHTRLCELGTNLYAKDRRKLANNNAAATASKGIGASSISGSSSSSSSSSTNISAADAKSATAELNLLAQLLGGTSTSSKESEHFSLPNLFPDTSLTINSKDGSKTVTADIITFDAEDLKTRQSQLEKQLKELNLDEPASNGDDDDLLDLMDKNKTDDYD